MERYMCRLDSGSGYSCKRFPTVLDLLNIGRETSERIRLVVIERDLMIFVRLTQRDDGEDKRVLGKTCFVGRSQYKHTVPSLPPSLFPFYVSE